MVKVSRVEMSHTFQIFTYSPYRVSNG